MNKVKKTLKLKLEKVSHHSGVLFRPSTISYNCQSVQVSLLSVQKARDCDATLKTSKISKLISSPR